MGGLRENLEVHLTERNDSGHEGNRSSRAFASSTLADELEYFDPRAAKCFTNADTQRLQEVIQVAGCEKIAKLVKDVFLAKLRVEPHS